jgi:hypothetical protein
MAAQCPYQKSRRIRGTVRLLLVIIAGRVDSLLNHYVINHTRIACVYVNNTHVRAGFDRGSDHFAVLVHNVARPLENITARSIRTVLANNESFEWLIIGRRPFLGCHFDDRSGYGYSFCGSCPLRCTLRTRLRKCQRRKHCAADEGDNCYLHICLPVDVNGYA